MAYQVIGLDPPREFTWQGSSGGIYSEPTNWDPEANAPPAHEGQSGDTATFGPLFDEGEITSYSVSAIGATAERFIIDRASVTLIGSAQVFEPSSLQPSLTIIRGGRLILENAARFTGVHGSVGFAPRIEGELAGLEIDGSDCSFSGRLIIGEFSNGELFLGGGAGLDCDQAIIGDIAAGTAFVSGADSLWDANAITLGATSADGTLEVHDAGRVEVAGQLVVGDLAPAVVRLIDGGKVVAGEVIIGKQATGDGTFEMDGDDGDEPSALEVNGPLRVGLAGGGALSIAKGSTVEAKELHFAPSAAEGSGQGPADSHVSVRGTDIEDFSSSLTVFNDCNLGHGLLDVFNGAKANFSKLSLGAGGITEVTVGGAAVVAGDAQIPASLFANQITVGFDNFGTLKVEAGGEVICTKLSVNSNDTKGTGRIVAGGGKITVNGTMRVSGDFQDGDNVIIEKDGGRINVKALLLGDQEASDPAEIIIRNGGNGDARPVMEINNGPSEGNGECAIGVDGPGVVRLQNSAFFGVNGSAKVGGSATGGEGLVEIGQNSNVTVIGNLDIGGASPGSIKLLTTESRLNVIGTTVVNNGGRIEGIGSLNDVIGGAIIKNPGGFVSPGLSPGTLTINGDYEQGEGGTLVMEIAGREPGQFDILKVTGNATLAGTLLVKFIDGFVPKDGDVLRMLDVDGNVVGQFGEVRIEGLPEGQTLNVDPETGLITVAATSPASADAPGSNACGAGLCGAGVAPFVWVSMFALSVRRPTRRTFY